MKLLFRVARPSRLGSLQELEKQAVGREAALIAFDRRNHLGVSESIAAK
jgi:hypothetical protein